MEALAPPWPGAVAVSGGGDSLALMHLLHAWAKRARREPPVVLTVDHGLHAAAAANARKVVRWAKDLGLKAHRLVWLGAKPASDVEAAARNARYRLMGDWCRKSGVAALFVAHTRDDQAETFLLRLARGSGLDGLAAMRPLAPYPVPGFGELTVVRPLIGLERETLRAHLAGLGHTWLEDPMNEESRFARVRIRAALAGLETSGLSKARIAAAARHLSRAREALDEVVAAVLSRACRLEDGTLCVDRTALVAAPREIGLRALSELLMAVSGQTYRPRFERLERLFDTIRFGRLGAGSTLHGCRIAPAPKRKAVFGKATLMIARERTHVPKKN